MRKVFVIAPVLYATLSLGTAAQQPANPAQRPASPADTAPASACPKVDVQTPTSQNVRDGQPVMFVANITGGDQGVMPTIVWNVSAGSIKDGQGTRRIEVDSTGAGVDRQIIADLWIGGYAPECTSQATARIKIVGHAAKVDEFGELEPEKENERLANVAASALQSNDNVHLIAYAGRTNVRGYAGTALRRIRTHLTALGIPAQRIGAVDGGFRETPAFEVWIVPEGAETPRPSPTVDRKEITFPSSTQVRATPPIRSGPAKKP